METIKNIIDKYNIGYVVACIFILFSIGLVCYWTGYHAGERNVDVERVQTVERQLDNASSQLDEATATNQSARNIVTDGVVINERIDASIDRSASAVERSQEANSRTGAAITESQQIVTGAKRTADESAKLIAGSKSILERAYRRTEGPASGRTPE